MPDIYFHDSYLVIPPWAFILLRAAVFLFGLWLVTYPAGWLVRRWMRSKATLLDAAHQLDDHAIASPTRRGFPDGGAVIGRLERLLLYLFLIGGTPGAIGFLIAAKSVFRFGELSKPANRLEAEYITIGTLMSFVVGLAIAMPVAWLLPRM